jgi:UDP-2,3-diacylglucosamine hydrolase
MVATPHPIPPDATLRYFITDLHLDGTDSPRALKFRELLQKLSGEAANHPLELFVLGDLFEFWYEYRKQIFELYAKDLAALQHAWEAGVKIFLICGNRDFAYGRYVNKRFGATVLGDGQQITLNDSRKVWLEHGDLLCTSDKRYLRFRSIIRSFPTRVAFRLMPWSQARKMIERIRKKTAEDKIKKSREALEIDHDAARTRMEQHGCKLLLCGHTHKPLSVDVGAGHRLIVLAPWCETPSGYLDDGRSFRGFQI